ncbi:MAG: hypothetical protein VYA34_13995 [Myxococcota bacterium]|nr:hypothetical protein [Myxococcota bacterium]
MVKLKSPRREFFPVVEMTSAQWDYILMMAKDVLGRVEGLEASIKERERVALYWDEDDTIVGLIAIDLREETFNGRKVVSIYTGNTWLHDKCRGMNLVPKLALRCYVEALLRWPFHHHYWFFGSNSYRSYLTMTRNFALCYPQRETQAPKWETAYIQYLAEAFYGAKINPETFVYETSGGRSFKEYAGGVPDSLNGDLDIEYFLKINPGFSEGDKVMCLGPLTMGNWRKIGIRSLKRKFGVLQGF